MTENGLIGRSGKFYSCEFTYHIQTAIDNINDAPFVAIRPDQVSFDDYYTANHTLPNKAQFETLMEWCTVNKKLFEDVTDCWCEPWSKWRNND